MTGRTAIHLGVAALRDGFYRIDYTLNMRPHVWPLLLAKNDDGNFSAREALLVTQVFIREAVDCAGRV